MQGESSDLEMVFDKVTLKYDRDCRSCGRRSTRELINDVLRRDYGIRIRIPCCDSTECGDNVVVIAISTALGGMAHTV